MPSRPISEGFPLQTARVRDKMRAGSKRLLQAVLHNCQEGDAEDSLKRLYQCDLTQLSPDLSPHFVQLQLDSETKAFLEESKRRSSNVCLQLLYGLVHILLGLFVSQTAINGLLEKGRMFVFSQDQLNRLLSSGPTLTQPLILDIGSGDGHVTDKIKELFGVPTIHVTETCRVMQRVLRRRKYKVLDASSWHRNKECKYDLISCLNVLDRCDKPLSMLRQITDNLRPGGILLLALVLPYEPFVERHSMQSQPSEQLPINNKCWEVGVSSLWEHVLRPLGYSPLGVSRVPYLCEGDLNTDYFALDDVLLALKKN